MVYLYFCYKIVLLFANSYYLVTNMWHQLKTKGPRPAKRFLGPATVAPHRNSVFMFGGVYAQVMNNFDQLSWSTNIHDVLRGESAEPDGSIS
jgi:hypothetical protein